MSGPIRKLYHKVDGESDVPEWQVKEVLAKFPDEWSESPWSTEPAAPVKRGRPFKVQPKDDSE